MQNISIEINTFYENCYIQTQLTCITGWIASIGNIDWFFLSSNICEITK